MVQPKIPASLQPPAKVPTVKQVRQQKSTTSANKNTASLQQATAQREELQLLMEQEGEKIRQLDLRSEGASSKAERRRIQVEKEAAQARRKTYQEAFRSLGQGESFTDFSQIKTEAKEQAQVARREQVAGFDRASKKISVPTGGFSRSDADKVIVYDSSGNVVRAIAKTSAGKEQLKNVVEQQVVSGTVQPTVKDFTRQSQIQDSNDGLYATIEEIRSPTATVYGGSREQFIPVTTADQIEFVNPTKEYAKSPEGKAFLAKQTYLQEQPETGSAVFTQGRYYDPSQTYTETVTPTTSGMSRAYNQPTVYQGSIGTQEKMVSGMLSEYPEERQSIIEKLNTDLPGGAGIYTGLYNEEIYVPTPASVKDLRVLIEQGNAKKLRAYLVEQRKILREDIAEFNTLKSRYDSGQITEQELNKLKKVQLRLSKGQIGTIGNLVYTSGQATSTGRAAVYGLEFSKSALQAAEYTGAFLLGAGAVSQVPVAGRVVGSIASSKTVSYIGRGAYPLIGGIETYSGYKETGDLGVGIARGSGTLVGFGVIDRAATLEGTYRTTRYYGARPPKTQSVIVSNQRGSTGITMTGTQGYRDVTSRAGFFGGRKVTAVKTVKSRDIIRGYRTTPKGVVEVDNAAAFRLLNEERFLLGSSKETVRLAESSITKPYGTTTREVTATTSKISPFDEAKELQQITIFQESGKTKTAIAEIGKEQEIARVKGTQAEEFLQLLSSGNTKTITKAKDAEYLFSVREGKVQVTTPKKGAPVGEAQDFEQFIFRSVTPEPTSSAFKPSGTLKRSPATLVEQEGELQLTNFITGVARDPNMITPSITAINPKTVTSSSANGLLKNNFLTGIISKPSSSSKTVTPTANEEKSFFLRIIPISTQASTDSTAEESSNASSLLPASSSQNTSKSRSSSSSSSSASQQADASQQQLISQPAVDQTPISTGLIVSPTIPEPTPTPDSSRIREQPRVPKKPGIIGINFGFPETKNDLVEGHRAQVYTNGRYVNIDNKAYTKKGAYDTVAQVVDNTIAGKGRVQPIRKGKKTKLFQKNDLIGTNNYYNTNRGKFRTYKIRKGKKVPLKNTLIERQNKRLDTAGEIAKITVAQYKARARRRGSFRL